MSSEKTNLHWQDIFDDVQLYSKLGHDDDCFDHRRRGRIELYQRGIQFCSSVRFNGRSIDRKCVLLLQGVSMELLVRRYNMGIWVPKKILLPARGIESTPLQRIGGGPRFTYSTLAL